MSRNRNIFTWEFHREKMMNMKEQALDKKILIGANKSPTYSEVKSRYSVSVIPLCAFMACYRMK